MIIYNIGNNRPVRVEVKVDDTRDELVAIITSIEGSADTTVIPLGSVTSLGVRVGAWAVAAVGRSVLDYALGPHRRPGTPPRGQA